jgi:hypothetical protein
MNDSGIVQWYNDVVDPTFLGAGERIVSSISPLLDQCFESLPVNLDTLLALLPYEADEFIEGNIIDRLVITLFNEEDERIADFWTKQQVMDIFFLMLPTSRRAKVRFRICLQLVTTWIDDIIPEEQPTEDQIKVMIINYFDVCTDFVSVGITCISQSDEKVLYTYLEHTPTF